jgi:hypothetical protein
MAFVKCDCQVLREGVVEIGGSGARRGQPSNLEVRSEKCGGAKLRLDSVESN